MHLRGIKELAKVPILRVVDTQYGFTGLTVEAFLSSS